MSREAGSRSIYLLSSSDRARLISLLVELLFQSFVYIEHSSEQIKKMHSGGLTMSTENRVEATLKNIEGKLQEAAGNVTGDPKMKAEGQAKQAESQVRHSVENVKDDIKKAID